MMTKRRTYGAGLWVLAAITLAAGLLALGVLTRPAEAAFPGLNGRILFTSERTGDVEIYATDRDGTLQSNLTNDPRYDIDPAISPDGKKVVFRRSNSGDDDIYIMDSDGSDQKVLVGRPGYDGQPSFSPDGSKIAFVSMRDSLRETTRPARSTLWT